MLLRIRPDVDDRIGSGSGLNIEIRNQGMKRFSQYIDISIIFFSFFFYTETKQSSVNFGVGSGFSCGQIRTRFLLNFFGSGSVSTPAGFRNTNKQSKVWKTITWIFTYTVDILLSAVNGSCPIKCAIYV